MPTHSPEKGNSYDGKALQRHSRRFVTPSILPVTALVSITFVLSNLPLLASCLWWLSGRWLGNVKCVEKKLKECKTSQVYKEINNERFGYLIVSKRVFFGYTYYWGYWEKSIQSTVSSPLHYHHPRGRHFGSAYRRSVLLLGNVIFYFLYGSRREFYSSLSGGVALVNNLYRIEFCKIKIPSTTGTRWRLAILLLGFQLEPIGITFVSWAELKSKNCFTPENLNSFWWKKHILPFILYCMSGCR